MRCRADAAAVEQVVAGTVTSPTTLMEPWPEPPALPLPAPGHAVVVLVRFRPARRITASVLLTASRSAKPSAS